MRERVCVCVRESEGEGECACEGEKEAGRKRIIDNQKEDFCFFNFSIQSTKIY